MHTSSRHHFSILAVVSSILIFMVTACHGTDSKADADSGVVIDGAVSVIDGAVSVIDGAVSAIDSSVVVSDATIMSDDGGQIDAGQVDGGPITDEDGGPGGGVCGDGVCDTTFGESCGTCSLDCGTCVCGDGTCSPGECSTCASDCPGGCTCGDVCQVGPPQDPSCDLCQATVCNEDSFCCQQNWDAACVSRVESLCGKECPAFCGDLSCDSNETALSCPDDCDIGPPPPPPLPQPLPAR